ncbi:MAG: hypothetical protein HC898_11350 [Phycisphaerales bacterium]|nr:hypothetical protein [Phycisphaerales bacterium]
MIVAGLLVGIVGTLWIQYNYGLSRDSYARNQVGQMMMDKTSSIIRVCRQLVRWKAP